MVRDRVGLQQSLVSCRAGANQQVFSPRFWKLLHERDSDAVLTGGWGLGNPAGQTLVRVCLQMLMNLQTDAAGLQRLKRIHMVTERLANV